MKRREFLKLSLIVGSGAVLTPKFIYAKPLELNNITFFTPPQNRQTIIVFLYGGASQLAGNITNIDEIEKDSFNKYSNYFTGAYSMTPTANGCWEEAGGSELEEMINAGDMTLFRTCFSNEREKVNNKAHGLCTMQNQKGSFDYDSAGVVTNLAQILEANGIVSQNSSMPFVTMEGESIFYNIGSNPISAYLKPIGLNRELENPYNRSIRDWLFYTKEERDSNPNYYKSDENGGFDPALDEKMTQLAQSINEDGKIKDAFSKREELAQRIENIKTQPTPDLGDDAYISGSQFSQSLESAIKILKHNPDTKVITISGSSGFGGWDDHSDSREYVERAKELFLSLKSAVAHLKAENKIDEVSIFVFGEFGRNVNLNTTFGWDHGNLQNLYVFGGKSYLNHKGVVGETFVDNEGVINRLYLKPTTTSYQFEPLSIASTIYKIHGVQNPEELTGYSEISSIFEV